MFAIFDHAALEQATAAGVARYKHAIPGSTKRQSPHWNADIVEQMVNERPDDVGGDASPSSPPRSACRRRTSRAPWRATTRGVGGGRDIDYLEGRRLPRTHRHPAVLRRRAAPGHRGVDGLWPAHRPRRRRVRDETAGPSPACSPPASAPAAWSAPSTSAAATTTPTASCSVASREPLRPPRCRAPSDLRRLVLGR